VHRWRNVIVRLFPDHNKTLLLTACAVVAVYFRPITAHEVELHAASEKAKRRALSQVCAQIQDHSVVTSLDTGPVIHQFDAVFDPDSRPSDVYQQSLFQFTAGLITGQNGTWSFSEETNRPLT
jgi:hypothetical protein